VAEVADERSRVTQPLTTGDTAVSVVGMLARVDPDQRVLDAEQQSG
jgi:hypothetical protein